MKIRKFRLSGDNGWTLVEAILSIVIMSVMVLGLTIVLLAFREHLDRSLAVRSMDQYGNDVIERLTHKLRNAVNVEVRKGRFIDKIDIEFLDPLTLDFTIWEYWSAVQNTVKINNRRIDDYFPPLRLRLGESYEIVKFTMRKYGDVDGPNDFERQDFFRRSNSFNDATWDIRFTLRYNRANIRSGDHKWIYEKEYYNRVYMRNMNLIVQKGITE
jgi:type II secretory pathway pseudopilin PulG